MSLHRIRGAGRLFKSVELMSKNYQQGLFTMTQQLPTRLFRLAMALALLIFFATYFCYLFRNQMHILGSSLALNVGASAFFCLIGYLTYRTSSTQAKAVRFVAAVGVAVTATVVFLLLFFLLVLNTIGA